MNRDQFKDCWDQLKVPLKRDWVKLTDDDLQRIRGDQEKFYATLVTRYGPQKGEVVKYADRWYARWSGWYEGYQELTTISDAPRNR
jgi:uncharacterized protein YjbJ (UPF0337 family)